MSSVAIAVEYFFKGFGVACLWPSPLVLRSQQHGVCLYFLLMVMCRLADCCCCWHSRAADLLHLWRFARPWPWPVWIQFSRDPVRRGRLKLACQIAGSQCTLCCLQYITVTEFRVFIILQYTIQYKTCNATYVTRMLFVDAGMTHD